MLLSLCFLDRSMVVRLREHVAYGFVQRPWYVKIMFLCLIVADLWNLMDSDTQVNGLRVRNQNRNIHHVQLKSMHDLM